MRLLPLFPLNLVAFPGEKLNLHIFEPRYRQLTVDLVTGAVPDKEFGIVAVRDGWTPDDDGIDGLHAVGCSAVVRDVSEPDGPGDGRYELITSGAVRFRLDGVDESAGTPYLTGLVSPVPERAGADPERLADLATSTAAAWTAYRVQLGIATTGVPGGVPEDPAVLSYLVMAGMVLDLPERQRLLELPDTASRLREERAILRREQVLISELRSLPAQELLDDPPVYN